MFRPLTKTISQQLKQEVMDKGFNQNQMAGN